jgi:hypothetical protein
VRQPAFAPSTTISPREGWWNAEPARGELRLPLVGPPEADEEPAATAAIDAWAEREAASGGALVAAEREDVTDGTAAHRWYLRFRGEEKEFITVWLTLRQRTLHVEAQFMPAPEERVTEVLQYLMRRNADLMGLTFCLGPEDAVFLVGRIPASTVDEDELDRIVGSAVFYIDEHYPTAMTLAHPGLYRRRRRRPGT